MMSQAMTLQDLKPEQINQRRNVAKPGSPGAVSTTFFRARVDNPIAPTAAINRYEAGVSRYSAAHFHEQDQFQIIMEGKGEFGRHHVSPYYIHFSKAYTPYGPLQSDKDTGWAFMVLRARYDPGAQRFPGSLEKLKQIPDRKPWQITKKVDFPSPADAGIALVGDPEMQDDAGLFTGAFTMEAGKKMLAPDPANGDGQFVVIVNGSLFHEGTEKKATGVVFIRPDEPRYEVIAGPEGLQGFILNFPKPAVQRTKAPQTAPSTAFKKWQCLLCAFAYDEAVGMPEEGIPAGTRWEDVPETWSCPDCAASKNEFEMVEVT